jgi:phage-related tail fiber protein
LNLNGQQFTAIGVTGEITVNGSGIGLSTTGATPGTYTKVTIDSKGRVTSGASATPTDIGAQPFNAKLTSFSNFNSYGIIAQTDSNTFANRTITGTAGRITVSDGDGIANNPVIDLQTTGVVSGTYSSVTVDAYGRVTSGSILSSNSIVESMTNGSSSNVSPGRAVYISGSSTFSLANSNNNSTAKVIGITNSSIPSNSIGPVVIEGIVELTSGN